MKRLILLILVFGLLVFAGLLVQTRVERRERIHGHWTHVNTAPHGPWAPEGERVWDDPTPGRTRRPPQPPRPPKAPKPPAPPKEASEPRIRTIAGRVSATEERARADARRELEAEVSQWLEPEVPPSWRPDPRRVESMIVGVKITPTEKPYGTVYTAEIDADFSDARRAEFVRSYERVIVRDRMLKLGGLLAFLLICLAAVSAFIRADEATKGYHTTRLRLIAAAGVGAAGVLIYQLLV